MIGTHFKKIIISLGIIAIAGGAYFYVYPVNGKDTAPVKKVKKVSHPSLAAVGSGMVDIEGGVAKISANLSGIITEIKIKEGEWIKKGQLLAVQEDAAEQIALEEALTRLGTQHTRIELTELQAATAKREFERIEPLYEMGAITSSEFDRAKDRIQEIAIQKKMNAANLMSTENSIQRARFRLAQRQIRAPLEGRVVDITATPGAGASTQNVSSLFSIIPNAPYTVKAKVDGAHLDKLYVGQKATVTTNYDKESVYNAVVTRISQLYHKPKNDNGFYRPPTRQMLDVTLRLDVKSLLIGQAVQVRFLKEVTEKDNKLSPTKDSADKGDGKDIAKELSE